MKDPEETTEKKDLEETIDRVKNEEESEEEEDKIVID
jgi:hypothetical protein